MFALFTLDNVLKVQPYCSVNQYHIPFNGWIIFYCMDILHFLSIHKLMDIWIVSAFWLLWICFAIKAIQVIFSFFWWTFVLVFSWVYTLCERICWINWQLSINFLGSCFPKWTQLFIFSPFLQSHQYFCLLIIAILVCGVVFHCDFDLHFFNNVWVFFQSVYGPFISSLRSLSNF